MRAYLVIPLLVLSLSCKSSDDAAPASSGKTKDQQDFITDYCALVAPCCGATNTCASTFTVPNDFNVTAGQACLATLRANAATSHFCASGALLAEVPACQLLQTRGTTPIGGACNDAVSGFECAEAAGTHVACVAGAGQQLCQTVTLGKLGDACVDDSNDDGTLPTGASIDGPATAAVAFCDRAGGLHCGGGGMCIGLATLGQSCTDTKSCALGAYCPFADPPTCLAKLADGSACTGDNDACQSGSCVSQRCSTAAEEGLAVGVCGGS